MEVELEKVLNSNISEDKNRLGLKVKTTSQNEQFSSDRLPGSLKAPTPTSGSSFHASPKLH